MDMFKHLLLPTDGSKLSHVAVEKGVEFAKEVSAKVTFVHVMPEYVVDAFVEFPSAAQASYNDFMKASEDTAKSILGAAQALAKTAGLSSDTVAVRHGQPWKAIIDVAGGRACDLIFMASHGRRGISALVLGSETHKVLTHSKIPVLVFR
ncbi:MAG: universal stress protein [Betaproteobacteria bacterium]|jgi:nucleotide-binding universal stress UspA family protein